MPFGRSTFTGATTLLTAASASAQPHQKLISVFDTEGGSYFTSVANVSGTNIDLIANSQPRFCPTQVPGSPPGPENYACTTTSRPISPGRIANLYNYTFVDPSQNPSSQRGEYFSPSPTPTVFLPPDQLGPNNTTGPETVVPYACEGDCGLVAPVLPSGSQSPIRIGTSAQRQCQCLTLW